MSAIGLDLPWRVHEGGYAVVLKRTHMRVAISGTRGEWEEEYLVGQGMLLEVEPLKNFDGLLCREFVTVSDAEGALSFVERFGPLTDKGLYGEGESVGEIVRQAWLMRRFIEAGSRGKPALKDMLPPPGEALGTIDVTLVPRVHQSRPEMRFAPRDLLTGIWIQFGQAAAGGLKIRRCGQCSALFEAGPGWGRRLDAKFCSEEHKIAFHSMARKRRG